LANLSSLIAMWRRTIQHSPNDRADLGNREWLLEECQIPCLHDIVCLPAASDYDGQLRTNSSHLSNEFEPRQIRHRLIGHNKIERLRVLEKGLERSLAVSVPGSRVPKALENPLAEITYQRLIVDDQDSLFSHQFLLPVLPIN
jgi:hypothetical protein